MVKHTQTTQTIVLNVFDHFVRLALNAVLQIRDFQLVGQWAEGLKGILSPPGGPGKMHISTSKKH